ncbi:hypothetical protein HC891_02325 [Candidatus Gracilibacteria bacterium]|nr:hypothetical protein [Candidatus Gracilibacteria bacterium]
MEIPRSTLAQWVGRCGIALQPLVDALREAIARALAKHWQLPVLTTGLVRSRDTGHQAKLARHERSANVAGAFAWQHKQPPPENSILIDDVLTTGSTLAACADALHSAGCTSVSAVALARSRPDLANARGILKLIDVQAPHGGADERGDEVRRGQGAAVRNPARTAPARPRADHRGRRAGG